MENLPLQNCHLSEPLKSTQVHFGPGELSPLQSSPGYRRFNSPPALRMPPHPKAAQHATARKGSNTSGGHPPSSHSLNNNPPACAQLKPFTSCSALDELVRGGRHFRYPHAPSFPSLPDQDLPDWLGLGGNGLNYSGANSSSSSYARLNTGILHGEKAWRKFTKAQIGLGSDSEDSSDTDDEGHKTPAPEGRRMPIRMPFRSCGNCLPQTVVSPCSGRHLSDLGHDAQYGGPGGVGTLEALPTRVTGPHDTQRDRYEQDKKEALMAQMRQALKQQAQQAQQERAQHGLQPQQHACPQQQQQGPQAEPQLGKGHKQAQAQQGQCPEHRAPAGRSACHVQQWFPFSNPCGTYEAHGVASNSPFASCFRAPLSTSAPSFACGNHNEPVALPLYAQPSMQSTGRLTDLEACTGTMSSHAQSSQPTLSSQQQLSPSHATTSPSFQSHSLSSQTTLLQQQHSSSIAAASPFLLNHSLSSLRTLSPQQHCSTSFFLDQHAPSPRQQTLPKGVSATSLLLPCTSVRSSTSARTPPQPVSSLFLHGASHHSSLDLNEQAAYSLSAPSPGNPALEDSGDSDSSTEPLTTYRRIDSMHARLPDSPRLCASHLSPNDTLFHTSSDQQTGQDHHSSHLGPRQYYSNHTNTRFGAQPSTFFQLLGHEHSSPSTSTSQVTAPPEQAAPSSRKAATRRAGQERSGPANGPRMKVTEADGYFDIPTCEGKGSIEGLLSAPGPGREARSTAGAGGALPNCGATAAAGATGPSTEGAAPAMGVVAVGGVCSGHLHVEELGKQQGEDGVQQQQQQQGVELGPSLLAQCLTQDSKQATEELRHAHSKQVSGQGADQGQGAQGPQGSDLGQLGGHTSLLSGSSGEEGARAGEGEEDEDSAEELVAALFARGTTCGECLWPAPQGASMHPSALTPCLETSSDSTAVWVSATTAPVAEQRPHAAKPASPRPEKKSGPVTSKELTASEPPLLPGTPKMDSTRASDTTESCHSGSVVEPQEAVLHAGQQPAVMPGTPKALFRRHCTSGALPSSPGLHGVANITLPAASCSMQPSRDSCQQQISHAHTSTVTPAHMDGSPTHTSPHPPAYTPARFTHAPPHTSAGPHPTTSPSRVAAATTPFAAAAGDIGAAFDAADAHMHAGASSIPLASDNPLGASAPVHSSALQPPPSTLQPSLSTHPNSFLDEALAAMAQPHTTHAQPSIPHVPTAEPAGVAAHRLHRSSAHGGSPVLTHSLNGRLWSMLSNKSTAGNVVKQGQRRSKDGKGLLDQRTRGNSSGSNSSSSSLVGSLVARLRKLSRSEAERALQEQQQQQ